LTVSGNLKSNHIYHPRLLQRSLLLEKLLTKIYKRKLKLAIYQISMEALANVMQHAFIVIKEYGQMLKIKLTSKTSNSQKWEWVELEKQLKNSSSKKTMMIKLTCSMIEVSKI
jgi:hypothetical protein